MSSTTKMSVTCISLIIIAISTMTFAGKTVDGNQGGDIVAEKKIEEVLKEYSEELMSLPGVVGTAEGLCDDKPCIKIYVIKRSPELDKKIPDILEGYPVVIEETGEIEALTEN